MTPLAAIHSSPAPPRTLVARRQRADTTSTPACASTSSSPSHVICLGSSGSSATGRWRSRESDSRVRALRRRRSAVTVRSTPETAAVTAADADECGRVHDNPRGAVTDALPARDDDADSPPIPLLVFVNGKSGGRKGGAQRILRSSAVPSPLPCLLLPSVLRNPTTFRCTPRGSQLA
jgi:hypothetical protein